MIYVIIYILVINMAGYITMGVDKRKARKHRRRISEKNLFTMAALGGAIGIWAGMSAFHHKTLHKKFKYGIPFLAIINIAAYTYAVYLTS